MCMSHETNCRCGNGFAGFNFKNEVMSGEVIDGLYCPGCSHDVTFDPKTMVSDNGWIIAYDMEIARFQAQKLRVNPEEVTPDFIFDEGYCTWRGVYPSDHIDSVVERQDLLTLAKINPRQYLDEMKEWANSRMDKLSKEGWRKTRAGKVGV